MWRDREPSMPSEEVFDCKDLPTTLSLRVPLRSGRILDSEVRTRTHTLLFLFCFVLFWCFVLFFFSVSFLQSRTREVMVRRGVDMCACARTDLD